MNIHKKGLRFGLILLFTILLSGPIGSQEQNAQPDRLEDAIIIDEDRLTLPRLNESSFYQRIDRKTQKILKDMGGSFTVEERHLLERIRGKVLKFLKEQNPYHHVRELFVKHGLGVGITAGITEFTTIVVLPAIFTVAEMPELAVMSAATPSFLASVPAYLGIKTMRMKRKLANKLFINNIEELDSLRNSILGYSSKNRLLSVIIARSKRELEIHVIKRPFSRFKNSPMGNIVDISEIKKIVTQREGVEVVELIKKASREDDALFAHLLLKQIQRNPESFNHFNELIKKRVTELPVTQHQLTQILLTHEKREVIKLRSRRVKEMKSNLLKVAETKAEKTVIREWSNSLMIDLQNLDFDIQRFEYNLLSQIHAQGDISNLDLTSSHTKVVERMKEIRVHLEKVQSWIGGEEKLATNKIIFRLKEFNRLWLPLEVRLTPRGDCYSWMKAILNHSGHI
jgi:hypothetical protein